MLFDIEDDDGLLAELLEGRVITVERDEDAVRLTYADGRKVVLMVSAFGLDLDEVPEC